MEQIIKQAHLMAKEKGFWETERNVPEMLMLIVSEVAEALEALRKDHFCDKKIASDLHFDVKNAFEMVKEPWKKGFEENVKSSFEDELADVAIRLFDLCGGLDIDLEKHIQIKMKYNSLREHKHGKKF